MDFIKKHKKKLLIGGGILLLLLVLLLLWLLRGGAAKAPTLVIQTPQKISQSYSSEFTVDVTVSALGDALYPAASMSISFDPTLLEFVGIDEGDLAVYSDDAGGRQLPAWSVNPEQCNRSGCINVMYLDMTGGRNAFSRDLVAEDGNVVLRLRFRLRGIASAGDVCELAFEDAIFAASDESQSLAMTTKTLKVINGKIVVGE